MRRCWFDVVDGDSADRRESLGVEQQEQARDSVSSVDGFVVEESFGLVPAFLVIQRPGRPGPSGGREAQVAVETL